MSRRREWLLLLVMIGIFIVIRALRLSYGFHFLHDQALFSFNALELWRDKAFTLIGPPTSWHVDGRYIFQGSVIYYLWMALLLIARFDPYLATWVYMVFASLMLIPLYFGVKRLVNISAALIMCFFYIFYPISIAATTELWNPHFQFALLPLLIYPLSRYQSSKQLWWMVATGVMVGFLLQFHYQFILAVIGLGIWSIFQKQYQALLSYIVGIFVGFSPLILFELRNDWYNTRTIVLLFSHPAQLFAGQSGLPYHYLLSLIPLLLILCLALGKRLLKNWMVVAVGIMLVLTVPQALHRLAKVEQDLSWDYRDEVKTYQLIRDQGLDDYNVTSFYQGIATPQRYLHLLDGIELLTDYYHNRYLFVIYPDETYGANSAYEMNTFVPSTKIGQWQINEKYNLYLLERAVTSEE
jgi:hypothetical protein